MSQIVIDDSTINSDLINYKGQKYPHITILKDTIVKPSIASEKYNNVFIEDINGYWKRLFHQYRYKGFIPMLQFAQQFSNSEQKDLSFGIKLMYWFAVIILNIRSFISTIYFYFYPYDRLSDEELLILSNKNLNWKSGLIRSFEWHPTSLRCALSLVNDLIYVYSADLLRPFNHICCLKNSLQKRISSIVWHPVKDTVLAVACENRILIWFIESDLKNFKPDYQKCLLVINPKLTIPLTSIVFNSEGNILVACSPRSSSLSVITFDWNTRECSVRLVRTFFSSQFTSLHWSPDKVRLLAHTTSNKIRIFESIKWSSKCWKSNLTSLCQTSCWSKPTGRILLYSPMKSSKIFALTFYDKAEADDVGGSPDDSVLILDTSEQHFPDVELGVEIQNMTWDRNSSRLAILFKDKPELIALYGTRISPSLEIWPLCTIRQKFSLSTDCIPLLIQYHDYYTDDGSLLTVCYSDGHISHIPLPTQQSEKIRDTVSSPARSLTSLCNSFTRSNGNNPNNHNHHNGNGSTIHDHSTSVLYSPANKSVIASPSTVNNNRNNVSFDHLNSPLSNQHNSSHNNNTPIYSPRRSQLFSTRVKFD